MGWLEIYYIVDYIVLIDERRSEQRNIVTVGEGSIERNTEFIYKTIEDGGKVCADVQRQQETEERLGDIRRVFRVYFRKQRKRGQFIQG